MNNEYKKKKIEKIKMPKNIYIMININLHYGYGRKREQNYFITRKNSQNMN